jgi:hypothetical protein
MAQQFTKSQSTNNDTIHFNPFFLCLPQHGGWLLFRNDARKKQKEMKILQLPNPGNNGRLGNQLFTIASTIGLALQHGYTPRFPADWKYRDVFNIPDEWFGKMEIDAVLRESIYECDSKFNDILPYVKGNIAIERSYLQSPKYWQGYEAEIRQYLTPKGCKPGIRDAVGIHYRRGDYVGNPNYVQLDDWYYIMAFKMLYIYGKPIVYRSDDAAAIMDSFGQTCGTEIEDFIALAECKEHITSNSTFSWWAAYLSNGKVIAPKQWFAGELAKRCSTKDLLPENWILI